MVKRLFWIAVGAAGALQADKWLREQKARFRPSVLTGTVLDKVNEKLERDRAAHAAPGMPSDRSPT